MFTEKEHVYRVHVCFLSPFMLSIFYTAMHVNTIFIYLTKRVHVMSGRLFIKVCVHRYGSMCYSYVAESSSCILFNISDTTESI